MSAKKYYFTYGTEGHPYRGGWAVVYAPDLKTAKQAFRQFHPDVIPGLLNCCSVYDEAGFNSTQMSVSGNLGHRARDIICLKRTVLDGEE